jgi:HEPN domain-containing protein
MMNKRDISPSSRTKARFRQVGLMGPEEKYQYWLTDAQYEMDTAEHMFATGCWFYVLFMCQQSIEKLAKGLYGLYFDFNTIPFTHRIELLIMPIADKVSLHISQDILGLLADLSKHFPNKQYPDYKQLLSQKVTRYEELRLLNLSREVFAWRQTLKPSEAKPEDTPPQSKP